MAGEEGKKKLLITPSHFQAPVKPLVAEETKIKKSKVQLLPPSQYTQQKNEDEPWKLLLEARKEIEQLKEDNIKLNENFEKRKADKREDIHSPVDIRRISYAPVEAVVSDELRAQIRALKQERSSLKSDLRKQEIQVSRLSMDLEISNENFQKELTRFQKVLEKQASTIKQLTTEIKNKEKEYEAEIQRLQSHGAKQNGVIKELRHEQKKFKEKIKMDRKDFENVIIERESRKCEDVEALENQIKDMENKLQQLTKDMIDKNTYMTQLLNELDQMEKRMKEMTIVYTQKEKELTESLANMEKKVELKDQGLVTAVGELKEVIHEKEVSCAASISEMEKELQNLKEDHNEEVEKLKSKKYFRNRLLCCLEMIWVVGPYIKGVGGKGVML